ncbi:MAG: terpene cyclase/mutase family protein [Planctomycetota bacterium]|nr:terpene cyclase/mutase family protein [Planctomycetota bacterium]
MKCIYCGAETPIRAEHCHQCGKKVVVDFDVLADSVQEDAAVRRTERIAGYLKWGILALLIVGAIMYCINDLFNQRLAYDGAGLPAMPTPVSAGVDVSASKKDYVEPRANPPLPTPRITAFGYRMNPLRDRIREANKGNTPPEKLNRTPQTAIREGLKSLAGGQLGDGSWPIKVLPNDYDQWNTKEYQWGCAGVTGLVILAYLGEGETWMPDPTTGKKPDFADTVFKGVRFLLNSQDAATGRFGPGEGAPYFMYNQGMATLAMCEAAGMSGDEHLRASAQKGLDFIVATQAAKGGWNYRGLPEGESDTSVSAWQVQALYAGREAGLKVPLDALAKALEMYRQATQTQTPPVFVRYWLGEEKSDRTKTSLCGVALMIRLLLGDDHRSAPIKKLAEVVVANPPPSKKDWGTGWKPGKPGGDDGARAKFDPYTVYFATYGMYFLGGKDWDTWHEATKKAVIEMQDMIPPLGAWRANDPWSMNAGTAYSTALCILTLQVYYRIQP